MNWKIVARKFGEGAIEGALISAAAITVLPGDKNYWNVLWATLAMGAIRGGLNALKHSGKGA